MSTRLGFATGSLGPFAVQPFANLGQQLFAVILAVDMMLVVMLVGGLGCFVWRMQSRGGVVEGGPRRAARGSLAAQLARWACAELFDGRARALLVELRLRNGLGNLDSCDADVSLR